MEKPNQTAAATNGVATQGLKQRHNKTLHPTAYSPLVPRSLSASGKLGVGLRRAAWLRAKVKSGVCAHRKVASFVRSRQRSRIASTCAAKSRRFGFVFVSSNRSCKYLYRKILLCVATRCFSSLYSCFAACKYLQAVFLRFRCRQVSRVAFHEYSRHVTISTAWFFALQVLAVGHLPQKPSSAAFQAHPNKALHPTDYSFARRSSSLRFRFWKEHLLKPPNFLSASKTLSQPSSWKKSKPKRNGMTLLPILRIFWHK